MSKPSVLSGALVGGMLAAPLTALFFLADRLAGLPLAPYDVLDWMARTLPGGVIRFGIDVIVAALTLLGLSVREGAKTAEQIMAVGGLVVTAAGVGAALFAILRTGQGRSAIVGGAAGGLVFGTLTALIGLSVNRMAGTGPLLGAMWVIGLFVVWGAACGWAYRRLIGAPAFPTSIKAAEALSVQALDRRRFLIRMGGGVAAITVIGAGVAAALATRREEEVGATASSPADIAEFPVELPNVSDPLIPAPGTRAEYTPLEEHYRIDINARPPMIDGETWRLIVRGMVERPLSLSLEEIAGRYTPIHRFVTLSCISNEIAGDLISTTLWTGASLQEVLADAGVQSGARYLTIRSADGFHEALALETVRNDGRIMLTYRWDGRLLPARHGFPLRLYIPDRYGMKQPKWITELIVTDEYEPGYWVVRNWDETARVQATSVIDTVAVEAAYEREGQTLIPIGGIAYAGARGISRVEVSVDEGAWVAATLRTPLSNTTWVIWRYDWPFEAGDHIFSVRCYEGDGTPQIERRAPTFPSGATGLHRLERRL